MRKARRLTALLASTALAVGALAFSASPSFACHKGQPHGQQSETEVTLEPVQDEPIVRICG